MRAGPVCAVDQDRHFNPTSDLLVVEKAQSRDSMYVQQLIQLRVQPAGLLVQQGTRSFGLSAQNCEKHLGVRVVGRQFNARERDQASAIRIDLALDDAGQILLDLVGQPQIAARDGFRLVTAHVETMFATFALQRTRNFLDFKDFQLVAHLDVVVAAQRKTAIEA